MEEYGDRIPAIFINGGGSSLLISSSVNGNKNFQKYGLTKPLPLETWTTIEISQTIEKNDEEEICFFQIKIGLDIFYRTINTNHRKMAKNKTYIYLIFGCTFFAPISKFGVKKFRCKKIGVKKNWCKKLV